VCVILWLVYMSSLLFGQESKKVAEIVPADRRLDTYAVYSAVLAHPSLSHPDNNQKYLVLELSGVPMEKNPGTCTVVPAAHLAAFSELLQDREKYQTRFLLERAVRSPSRMTSLPRTKPTSLRSCDWAATQLMK
jgi:hypothetical protein